MDYLMCRRIFVSFLFFICMRPFALLAVAPEEKTESKSLKNIIIDENNQISNRIDRAAQRLDLALVGEKADKSTNHTHVIVRQRLDWKEGGPFTYNPYLDLRLSLPSLEKKWHLKFTTYDQDQEERGINRNRLQTSPARQTYAGNLGFFQKLGNLNTEFQPRVEFRDGLQTSYILKFSTINPAPHFVFFPELQLFAKSDQGVGEFLALNLNIPLYQSLVLALINEEQYVDQENLFTTNSGIRFSHDLGPYINHSYSLMFESSGRPTYHLDRYTVTLGFTHKLMKNIIHYTLMPYLAFSRELNFKGSPGIILEVSVIF